MGGGEGYPKTNEGMDMDMDRVGTGRGPRRVAMTEKGNERRAHARICTLKLKTKGKESHQGKETK
jgi:hypothetical protein